MAILVQRMVHPDVAGVVFTVDPLTGNRGRIVVEAVAGLGEALVSGLAAAERVVLSREGLDLIGDGEAGGVLTRALAYEAAAQALRAETLFGSPQDIEFAFEGGQFWMLQSRPITAAGGTAEQDGELDTPTTAADLWTSANVQEVLPGLLTPLSISIVAGRMGDAYVQGYRALKMLGKDETPSFIGFFHHRAFLNVNATRLIADRAFGSSGDAIEHRFLGGEYRARPRRRHSLSNWKHRFLSAWPTLKMTRQIGAWADRIERETLAMEASIRALDVRSLSDVELDRRRIAATDFVTGTFAVHLQASGCAGAGFDFVSRVLYPVLKEETEAVMPGLFTGLQGVESAQISLDLWALSRAALGHGMAEAVRDAAFDPANASLPQAWRDAYTSFTERHGHRRINEMEPSAKSWRADPAPVVSVIRSYLDLDEQLSPPRILARQEAERLRLTESVFKRMGWLRRAIFKPILKDAQKWVALREQTKSTIVRGARFSEYYIPEIQRRFLAAGVIDDADDVFFLTDPELTASLATSTPAPLVATVARRRRSFERDRYLTLPDRFTGRPDPIDPPVTDGAKTLTGTPVSPGRVTGRARVIRDPATDGPMLPGEILVAPVTDAGWTPLFALATGLVVDIGSALSHGSTVAREYGLPAVVNVRTGTTTIRTGDLISIDGGTGVVTIFETGE